MRCPDCSRNHRKKDGMTCSCGYGFVFNPATDHGWTDGKFLALIRQASHNKTYYFTRNQLLTYARKRKHSKFLKSLGLLFLSVILGIFTALISQNWLLGIITGIVAYVGFSIYKYREMRLSRDRLYSMLDLWIRQKGKIENLIEKPQLHKPPPEWKENDIYDYGVEWILIVQHDIMVDLLVKNNFHADQRTLILSLSGYPAYLFKHFKKIIDENPSLKIYVLHDSMSETDGQRYLQQVKAKFYLTKHEVVDLGIYPNNTPLIFKSVKSKPEGHGRDIAMDFIPFPFLSSLMVLSMEKGVDFTQILEDAARAEHAAQDSAGSFG